MELTKDQVEGFSKIIKKGLSHYKIVPNAIGQIETKNDQNIIGFVTWLDPEGSFTTSEGYSKQEFYIRTDGVVCTIKEGIFKPVNFKARVWSTFIEGSEQNGN